MNHARRLLLGVVSVLALVPVVAFATTAGARGNRVVDVACSGPNGGVEALVRAIDRANEEGSGGIRLARGCTYTIAVPASVDAGLPTITANLSVDGRSATIARSSAPGTPEFRLIDVAEAGRVAIDDLRVRGGSADTGGGIRNAGELVVERSTVSGNVASGAGGGIGNTGYLRISRSTVSGNSATSGGGIVSSGTLVAERTRITANTAADPGPGGFAGGGGIAAEIGPVTLTRSEVSGNSASAPGGQAAGGGMLSGSSTIVERTTFSGNLASAPGGVARGGAVLQDKNTAAFERSVITSNTASAFGGAASEGGIGRNDATVELRRTTSWGNEPAP